MTGTIVTALVLDVLALSLVRLAQLFASGRPRLQAAGTTQRAAPRWSNRLDRVALALSLLAGLLILAWLLLG